MGSLRGAPPLFFYPSPSPLAERYERQNFYEELCLGLLRIFIFLKFHHELSLNETDPSD